MGTINNKFKESFLEKANIKHNYEYDYSSIKYINSQTKVEIICNKHGVFKQTPNNHLSGQKCPFCNGNPKSNKFDFINKSILKHSNKYDYSLVEYKNNKLKVRMICKEHGEFLQSPNRHLIGQGCPKCDKSCKIEIEDFVKRSYLKHGDKYDYSLVKFKNTLDEVEIICKEHGLFVQVLRNHLNGYGCKICGGNMKLSNDDFIKRSNIIHNNKYDYSLIKYKNSLSKVKIICNEHGEFLQKPNKHLGGQGCPKCAVRYGIMENKWLDMMCVIDRQINIGKYIVDGFDKENNIIYEFNGDFWHGNPKVFKSDEVNNVIGKTFGELYEDTLMKEDYLIKMGYKVISIWESDYLNKLSK